MKKVMKKRTGFTLVELLIVIIIIGILAGAMLLVAGSGTDKAEATKIVSDMRGLKAAALMYYADKGSDPAKPEIEDLKPYMDRDVENKGFEIVEGADDDTQWWIEKDPVGKGVGEKLAQVAESTGLYKGATQSGDYYEYGTAANVYMRAR
jgi:general secretion pathway protein G